MARDGQGSDDQVRWFRQYRRYRQYRRFYRQYRQRTNNYRHYTNVRVQSKWHEDSLAALAKAGAVPLHTWIPAAAADAPSTSSATPTYSYTNSSGRMTLKLELYDSETGDLIALASDKQQSPYRGYMQWTTGPSNRGDARDMLRKWAQALNTRLQESTGKSPQGGDS